MRPAAHLTLDKPHDAEQTNLVANVVAAVHALITPEVPYATQTQIVEEVGKRKKEVVAALEEACAKGLLSVRKGERNALHYYPTLFQPPGNSSEQLPGAPVSESCSPHPFRGVGTAQEGTVPADRNSSSFQRRRGRRAAGAEGVIELLIVASWIVVAALYVPLVPSIVRSLRRRRQRRLEDGAVLDAVKGKEAA